MEEKTIVDRGKEKTILGNELEGFLSQPSCVSGIFVYSEEGYGKTALIEAVESTVDTPCVHVKTLRFNNGLFPQGEYFRLFCEAFSSAYPDFQEPEFTRIEPGISVGLNLLPVSIGASFSICARSEEEKRAYYAKRISEYCRMKWKHPVFVLEDCNCIDQESIRLILDVANELTNALFIFEYSVTPDRSPEEYIETIENELSSRMRMQQSLHLEMLSFHDAAKTLPKELVANIAKEKLQRIYQQSGGNLLQFRTLCKNHVRAMQKTAADSVVRSLDNIITDLIALYDKPVSVSRIEASLKRTSIPLETISEIGKACANLTDLEVLHETCDHSLFVQNRSFAASAAQDRVSFMTAYSAFISDMAEEARIANDMNNWYYLLNAQLSAHDEGMLDALAEVKADLCKAPLPKAFILESASFINALSSQGPTKLLSEARFALFDLFYTASDHAGAKEFLNLSGGDDLLSLLFNYSVDVIRPEADKRSIVSQMSTLLSSKPSLNGRLELYIRMSYLTYLMRFGARDEAMSYSDKLLMSGDENYPEYYWIRKLRTGYLANSAATRELEICCERLETRCSNPTLACRARLTYASRLAMLGESKEAQAVLYEDFDKRADPFRRDYYYYNNIAACDLMRKSVTDSTLWLLQMAELYPATPYEHALIQNNLMIVYSLQGDHARAGRYVRDIETALARGYSTQAFLHLCYSNLLAHYRSVGNEEAAESVVKKLVELGRSANEGLKRCIVAQIEGTMLDAMEDLSYVTFLGFRPGFIGYWQMPIDRNLIEGMIR